MPAYRASALRLGRPEPPLHAAAAHALRASASGPRPWPLRPRALAPPATDRPSDACSALLTLETIPVNHGQATGWPWRSSASSALLAVCTPSRRSAAAADVRGMRRMSCRTTPAPSSSCIGPLGTSASSASCGSASRAALASWRWRSAPSATRTRAARTRPAAATCASSDRCASLAPRAPLARRAPPPFRCWRPAGARRPALGPAPTPAATLLLKTQTAPGARLVHLVAW